MDFEKLIHSIENLLYMIIVEISLVFFTVAKLYRNTKNCFDIVESEESIEDENLRYRNYSSPIKMGVLIALATIALFNTSFDLDSKEEEARADVEQIQDSIQNISTSDTTVMIDSNVNDVQSLEASTQEIEANDEADGSTDEAAEDTDQQSDQRTENLLDVVSAKVEKMEFYQIAALIFVICNLNAILISMLLVRLRKENFPSNIFRNSFFSLIYARVYLTFPIMVMLMIDLFISTASTKTDTPVSIPEILQLFAFCFFIFGFYKYLRASLYTIKSVLGKFSWFLFFSFLLLLLLLDSWWIYYLIKIFRTIG